MVVQALAPDSPDAVPWDLIAVNVAGSLLLAAAVAVTQARGPWRLFPGIGPGFFGGFTTFSALACLEWSAGASPAMAAGVLAATIAACVAGAAIGWWVGDRPPTPVDERAVFEQENE